MLTEGFEIEPSAGITQEQALAMTKAWRGKLWKQFREIEDRLCPVQARDRLYQHK